MPTFLFTYRMPTDYVPGRADTAAVWSAWFQGMGQRLADRGHPVFDGTALGRCGEGTRLGGYSILTAEDLESATALAKGCPCLDAGGGVEVGVITVLGPDGSLSGRD